MPCISCWKPIFPWKDYITFTTVVSVGKYLLYAIFHFMHFTSAEYQQCSEINVLYWGCSISILLLFSVVNTVPIIFKAFENSLEISPFEEPVVTNVIISALEF